MHHARGRVVAGAKRQRPAACGRASGVVSEFAPGGGDQLSQFKKRRQRFHRRRRLDDQHWRVHQLRDRDRKSTRLNSSHVEISYAVFCLKKKKKKKKKLKKKKKNKKKKQKNKKKTKN